ncbi:MAG: YitT family protein [Bacilli bacterium]|nr:YitT family protein [Bacilli bacterium]
MFNFKTMTKKQKIRWFVNLFLVIFGTVLVSFGNVAFLVPLNINAGGLSGVGIIARFFTPEQYKVLVYNLVVATLSVVLWIFGRICIGREFAYKTLVATIVFPLANALFTAVPGVSDGINHLAKLLIVAGNADGNISAGNYLLCGLFGGVFVGAGVAVTFVGGGSTGGVDVLTFLMEKYLHIKQSLASFIVDGTIVTIGLLSLVSFDNTMLISCLTGIVSTVITAILIDFIYIGSQSSYQADIISEKWEDISRYVQDELERGATIIRAEGGYKGDNRVMLRVVCDRRQYEALKKQISLIDPHAFVTYTRTSATFGEGFKSHYVPINSKKKKNDNNEK